MSIRKVGGIWFSRLGRIRLSFCIARPRYDWHVLSIAGNTYYTRVRSS